VASDVVGIQLFSNVDAFDTLQKDLATKAAAFESQISATMKTRKGEVDKAQDDLVLSIKSRTQAYLDRNWQRALFEGYNDAITFLCCPDCDKLCPKPTTDQNKPQYQATSNTSGNCSEDCPPRLKYYETCVCTICKEVQKTFCCNDTVTVKDCPPPTTPPPTGC
jgi:hypothetical protein